jgi:hypothetical protein
MAKHPKPEEIVAKLRQADVLISHPDRPQGEFRHASWLRGCAGAAPQQSPATCSDVGDGAFCPR